MTTAHDSQVDRLPWWNPVGKLLVLLMRAWQLVPRIDAQRCRFYPSCSAYGITAVRRFGVVRGGWLAMRRVGRCHPWNPGGVDHVPPRIQPGATHDDTTTMTSEGQ